MMVRAKQAPRVRVVFRRCGEGWFDVLIFAKQRTTDHASEFGTLTDEPFHIRRDGAGESMFVRVRRHSAIQYRRGRLLLELGHVDEKLRDPEVRTPATPNAD